MNHSGEGLPVFSGGDDAEVRRWLGNFVTSHAKRESPRVEGVVQGQGAGETGRYGVRLRLGARHAPALGAAPLELGFAEVARNRGRLDWCETLAGRVRALARELLDAERESRQSP